MNLLKRQTNSHWHEKFKGPDVTVLDELAEAANEFSMAREVYLVTGRSFATCWRLSQQERLAVPCVDNLFAFCRRKSSTMRRASTIRTPPAPPGNRRRRRRRRQRTTGAITISKRTIGRRRRTGLVKGIPRKEPKAEGEIGEEEGSEDEEGSEEEEEVEGEEEEEDDEDDDEMAE